MTARASIWSEIRMTPISAVMAEPAQGCHHDSRQHRSHLPDQGQREQGAEHPLSPEHGHGVKFLKAKDQAGKNTNQQNDKHRLSADGVYLPDDLPRKTVSEK